MAGVYARTVTIKRPATGIAGNGGNVGYSGIQASHAGDTVIATGVPASIQAPSMGATRRGPQLPADAPGPLVWNIYLPIVDALPLGTIKDRDFVIDDLGNKYLIGAAYWTPISWKLACIKEEA